ncbi:histidine kinase [Nocardioides sp. R-C-SC26]|uniref:sensor histidine kinase n=1 Tax=Nocardioides sp. R-C-SC26 TaxID=2870414 RepID=UPI001E304B80|nr:histidine kinase [Nocardioides sp. R-C-SC26]
MPASTTPLDDPGAPAGGASGGSSDVVHVRAAAALVAVGAIATVAASVLRLLAEQRASDLQPMGYANLVIGFTWPLAGWVVVRSSPRNACGWLLLATSWLAVYGLIGEYSVWSHYVAALPGAVVADWVSSWGFAVYLLVLPLVPMTFPDGRLPSPQWRPMAGVVIAGAVLIAVARMFVPGGSDINVEIENPLGIHGMDWLNYLVLAGALVCNGLGIPAGIVAIVVRTRRAVGIERIQLQWLMLGGLMLLMGMVIGLILGNDALFSVGLLGPPVAVGVSVVRHRLIDVDLALQRTAVFLAVVVLVGAGGAWLLLRLDPGVTATRAGVLLVAGLAVAIVAVWSLTQRWIDRRWFPHRQTAASLGARVLIAARDAGEPQEALESLVRATAATLRLPYVAFVGARGDRTASGLRPDRVVSLDGVAMGRVVGVLEVAPRAGAEGFSRSERQVLEQGAAQAAMLGYAATLVADVASSRRSIVAAREEERRRLRNDLHDGVGPSLAGIALQVDALAVGLDVESPDAAARVRAVRDRIRDAVAEVRAVSHGLRPPVLDQLGLEESLRQLVRGAEPIGGVADVGDLGEVSAASEVAAYAIAAEAVGNVVRHSGASHLRVEADRVGEELRVRVVDNGRGMPGTVVGGVGTASMRQRATEIGGRVVHEPNPGGGTAVLAVLPVQPAPPGAVPPELAGARP